MSRRIKALLVTAMVALGLVVAVQTPAQASFSQCNALSVQMCGWIDANYLGGFRTFSNPNGVCTNLNSDWNNKLTSVWNHRPLEEIRFFGATNCSTTQGLLIVNPNSGSPNLGLVGGGWNDKISSYIVVWD